MDTQADIKRNNKPAVVDLFSGVGGLSLGAARAGFRVAIAVDNDREVITAHQRNFPGTTHLETDVSGLTGHALRVLSDVTGGNIAGIIGGPPCQGFSSIGKSEPTDKRNSLFAEFFRVVGETQPKFFLAENVPGIMREKNAGLRDEAFAYVKKDYTLLPPMTLKANEYSVPTDRRRVFFFGYKPEELGPLFEEDFLPPNDSELVFVRHALKGLPDKIKAKWQSEPESWRVARVYCDGYFGARLQGYVPSGVGDAIALARLKNERRASGFLGTVHSEKVLKRFAKIAPGKRDPISKSRRLDPNGLCPTLTAGTGPEFGSYQAVRPLHPTENRVITPREAARLQGFPDWFQFSPTKWHSFRQIGSSVSPVLAERILSVIIGVLVGVKRKGVAR